MLFAEPGFFQRTSVPVPENAIRLVGDDEIRQFVVIPADKDRKRIPHVVPAPGGAKHLVAKKSDRFSFGVNQFRSTIGRPGFGSVIDDDPRPAVASADEQVVVAVVVPVAYERR